MKRYALLLQFDGTDAEYREIGDVVADAAMSIIGERADIGGQGFGDHPLDCPAAAYISVINCECGGRSSNGGYTGGEA